MRLFVCLLVAAMTAAGAFGEEINGPRLRAEIERLDARASEPAQKPIVAAVLSERLGIHRNRLALIRYNTGKSYGHIFASMLAERGLGAEDILKELQAAQSQINERWSSFEAEGSIGRETGAVRPVALLTTGFDRNSAGSFQSAIPEFGFQWRQVFVTGGAFRCTGSRRARGLQPGSGTHSFRQASSGRRRGLHSVQC